MITTASGDGDERTSGAGLSDGRGAWPAAWERRSQWTRGGWWSSVREWHGRWVQRAPPPGRAAALDG